MKCDFCGSIIIPGNKPTGEPNGLGFQMKDGTIINACADCITAAGLGDQTIINKLKMFAEEHEK